MAYTRDEAGPSVSRPLLFSSNGGPGSSAVWLHLGALGPRRVAAPEGPTILTPPFAPVDNETTEVGGIKGFDAGKKVKGPKRHMVVDTLGLLIAVVVAAA
jgi:hypothetical protein